MDGCWNPCLAEVSASEISRETVAKILIETGVIEVVSGDDHPYLESLREQLGEA